MSPEPSGDGLFSEQVPRRGIILGVGVVTEPQRETVELTKADVVMHRLLRLPLDRQRRSVVEARSAFRTSVVLSGLRCLITYLVFPVLGPLGTFGSLQWPVFVLLGALAVVFSVRSMRRFWAANHRYRWSYTGFAVVVIAWVFVDLAMRLASI